MKDGGGVETLLTSHNPEFTDRFKAAGLISEKIPSNMYKLGITTLGDRMLIQAVDHSMLIEADGTWEIMSDSTGDVVLSN